MKTLLVGPWIGEFGWEIVKWVPFVRKYVEGKEFDDIIIVTRNSSFPLYFDFGISYISYNARGDTKIYVCNNSKPKAPERLITKFKPSEILVPSPGSMFAEPSKYKYHTYGIAHNVRKVNVICHARATNKNSSGTKNWDSDRWKTLCKMLSKIGKSIAFVGSMEQSYCAPGYEDLRGRALPSVMNILRAADLCIGPSSGPMHLASLCACPHLVWGDSKLWNSGYEKSDLEKRYLSLWNPLKTPCKYISDPNWNPSVSDVYMNIIKILA